MRFDRQDGSDGGRLLDRALKESPHGQPAIVLGGWKPFRSPQLVPWVSERERVLRDLVREHVYGSKL